MHHFLLFQDGGAIDVTVKDPSDTKNLDAIRSHLPHIAAMFSSGNFDAPMLVHDSANVPGTISASKNSSRCARNYAACSRTGTKDWRGQRQTSGRICWKHSVRGRLSSELAVSATHLHDVVDRPPSVGRVDECVTGGSTEHLCLSGAIEKPTER